MKKATTLDRETLISIVEKMLSMKRRPAREVFGKREVNLRKRYFVRGDFSYTPIYNTDFSGSWLQKANFSHTVLEKVKFIGADLSEADFTEATFKDVDFTDANLHKTKFNSIKIEGEFNIWKAKNPKEIEANIEGLREIVEYLRMRAQDEPDESERRQIEELRDYFEDLLNSKTSES
ncbi:MAG: hypothetical protein DRQ10_04740 [Candidatus Hydrothermota bacterium]|nr:MAG: hypothetical protein DRQ10_04740 [Candidatus Hydrothermae bacterium]